MYIEKITINNFRIYYGQNVISFNPFSKNNVNIISGNNGSGKTTFLTALVWCLYGNQMQEVDKFYRDRVLSSGGYKKYLASSINRKAYISGDTEFSVSIIFKYVELPGISCDSMQITRKCNCVNLTDSLEIVIDNNVSELVDDTGAQMFIQDFILPKEIANFFFFDAEKIVEIAEIQSVKEKKLLCQAYSEVLGIKKYDDLKNSLNDLHIRFRKDSADEEEKAQFKDLVKEIKRLEKAIEQKEQKKENLIIQKRDLRIESDILHEKLLREGNTLTVSEIHELQVEKSRLYEEGKTLVNEFRDLFEYAPFAITGNLLTMIDSQLGIEIRHNKSGIDRVLIKDKMDKILHDLADDMNDITRNVHKGIKDYYISKVTELMNTHLIESEDNNRVDDFVVLHDFTDEEYNSFKAMLSNLKTTYRERLQALNRSLRINKAAYSDLSKKLAAAESVESDELIQSYREEKRKMDNKIHSIDEETLELSQNIGGLESSLLSKRRLFEEIAKKIKVNTEYKDKDQLVNRLIEELGSFTVKMKTEKKNSLEKRILSNLNVLMYKKDFINKVVIEVNGDILDINLFDKKYNEIKKDDLSKGEQQLYATAILKALVEESGIEFPIFVDSPLQKFDDKHSKNIITSFYPQISKQVIIFPLLNKELSQEEYRLLIDHVASTFIIENFDADSSGFKEVRPYDLFNECLEVRNFHEYA